ncbi:MAG: gliding motility-associated C-terminal domain-containing protein [Janthinobacterium lividum]
MRFFYHSFLLFCLFAVMVLHAHAQSCSGNLGSPVINETFGAGKTLGLGPALADGITTMVYEADDCAGPDNLVEPRGLYTIATSMGSACKGATWQTIAHDHTGDKNGYFMIINASDEPSIFYQLRIDGSKLCPNTTYFFGAYIMNILRDLPSTKGYIKPNVTFRIETVSGQLLASFNTGDIPSIKENYPVVFTQYGGTFTTTAKSDDLILKMINNAPGGDGNDLAMDDITFSPCGPVIQTGFNTIADTVSKSACSNANLNYALVSSYRDYINPDYQWQQNNNDGKGWINIAGATSATYPLVLSNAVVGAYQYRVGLLNKSQFGSEACRIYSNPLTVNVYPYPPTNVPATTTTCVDQILTLSSTGGDDYQWTGPNSFTSTESSPIVDYKASSADNGIYYVRVSNHGCPVFQQTQITVYPAPSVAPLTDLTVCEGSTVQLTASGNNVTHYKWSPATGLDHADIANPIASPAVTTTYLVSASNDGCPDVAPTASLTITVLKKPLADAGKSFKIFEGQSVTLQGKETGSYASTVWTPASYLDNANLLTPIATPTADITYTLHVLAAMSCGESTSTVFIRVYKKLLIPNTFSPNNDGINDYWNIGNISNYPNATVSVYNRYGQQVFYSIGYSKAWNGAYNYKPLSVGTYYYVVDLKEDNLPKLSGWLLLAK